MDLIFWNHYSFYANEYLVRIIQVRNKYTDEEVDKDLYGKIGLVKTYQGTKIPFILLLPVEGSVEEKKIEITNDDDKTTLTKEEREKYGTGTLEWKV